MTQRISDQSSSSINLIWTEDKIEKLTKLWSENTPARHIATVLKCSKNAVIGKARRLKLQRRPSPIIRREEPEQERQPEPKIIFDKSFGHTCVEPTCNEPVHKRGYCEAHFSRYYVVRNHDAMEE